MIQILSTVKFFCYRDGSAQWCFEASDADFAHSNVLVICNLSCGSTDTVMLSSKDLYPRNELGYLLITTSMIPATDRRMSE